MCWRRDRDRPPVRADRHRAGDGSGGDHPRQAAQDRRLDPHYHASGWISLSTAYPWQSLFRRVARRLVVVELLHPVPVKRLPALCQHTWKDADCHGMETCALEYRLAPGGSEHDAPVLSANTALPPSPLPTRAPIMPFRPVDLAKDPLIKRVDRSGLAPGGVASLHVGVRPHPLPGVRIASSSSSVRGQSLFRRRESARSARSLPPVWHSGQ